MKTKIKRTLKALALLSALLIYIYGSGAIGECMFVAKCRDLRDRKLYDKPSIVETKDIQDSSGSSKAWSRLL